jgi:hypothetical protein
MALSLHTVDSLLAGKEAIVHNELLVGPARTEAAIEDVKIEDGEIPADAHLLVSG